MARRSEGQAGGRTARREGARGAAWGEGAQGGRGRARGTAGGGSAGLSQRQLRVGELIRRTLAEVLSRGEIHDPALWDASITVGEVRASPDLRVATVHVLPLGGRDAEGAIEALERNRHEIRRRVARQMTLKFAPELRFRLDDTFDRLDAARRLFQDEAVRRDVQGARDAAGLAVSGAPEEDGAEGPAGPALEGREAREAGGEAASRAPDRAADAALRAEGAGGRAGGAREDGSEVDGSAGDGGARGPERGRA